MRSVIELKHPKFSKTLDRVILGGIFALSYWPVHRISYSCWLRSIDHFDSQITWSLILGPKQPSQLYDPWHATLHCRRWNYGPGYHPECVRVCISYATFELSGNGEPPRWPQRTNIKS
jgi:hypothetical protein